MILECFSCQMDNYQLLIDVSIWQNSRVLLTTVQLFENFPCLTDFHFCLCNLFVPGQSHRIMESCSMEIGPSAQHPRADQDGPSTLVSPACVCPMFLQIFPIHEDFILIFEQNGMLLCCKVQWFDIWSPVYSNSWNLRKYP